MSLEMVKMNAEDLRIWLVEHLAELRGVSAQEIDPGGLFHRQGLDSLGASRLIADLPAVLARPISRTSISGAPNIAWGQLYYCESYFLCFGAHGPEHDGGDSALFGA